MHCARGERSGHSAFPKSVPFEATSLMSNATSLEDALDIMVRELQGTSLPPTRIQGHARLLSAAANALDSVMPDGFFDTEPAQMGPLMTRTKEGRS